MNNKKKYYYFAYGMNTNKSEMTYRCPDSVSLGFALLFDYQFKFNIHADVVSKSGSKTNGVLWEITDECLDSLDRLEGYPTYYTRIIVPILYQNKIYDSWVYTMTSKDSFSPPSVNYWQCLLEGYKEHDVNTRQLHEALKLSYEFID